MRVQEVWRRCEVVTVPPAQPAKPWAEAPCPSCESAPRPAVLTEQTEAKASVNEWQGMSRIGGMAGRLERRRPPGASAC